MGKAPCFPKRIKLERFLRKGKEGRGREGCAIQDLTREGIPSSAACNPQATRRLLMALCADGLIISEPGN